jgi:hypothetical protein
MPCCVGARHCQEYLIGEERTVLFRFMSPAYRPIGQAAAGVVCVVVGLFALTRVMFTVGALLIVWAIVSAILYRRARSRRAGDAGGGP